MKILYYLGWSVTRVISKLIFRIKISGGENFPPSGGFILATNHISYYDPPLVGSWAPRQVYFFAKQELFKNKLFGWIIRQTNALPVRRGAIDRQALELSLDVISRGYGLTIFPEGTRSKTGALQPGKPGVSYLAAKSGYPVLPVALMGTEDRYVLEQLKHFRRIHIIATAGKLMTLEMPQGKNREQILDDQTEEIMCQIAALLPKSYHGVYADNPRLKELMENA